MHVSDPDVCTVPEVEGLQRVARKRQVQEDRAVQEGTQQQSLYRQPG